MFHLLAQTVTDYTVTTDSEVNKGALALFGGTFLLVWLVLAVVMVVSLWKVFVKAGRPGWVALVPVYNTWVLAEVVGRPGWWGLYPLLGVIPFLGGILALVVGVILSIDLAKSFGKDPAFAALLILLPIVGYPMLAFGDAKYTGPSASGGAGTTQPTA